MVRKAILAAALAVGVLAPPAGADQAASSQRLGANSGLPLPRFVSLDTDQANGLRRPSSDAPVDWIYVAPGLPLQVTAEQGSWRRVRDPDGTQVWMHVSALSNTSSVFVRGGNRHEAILRTAPDANARTRAILEQGVIATVTDCETGWVKLAVNDLEGWVRADALWGANACQ
ncbi:MAG: SH3 domain-containing protein [Caulobacterales bacterium]